MKSPRRAPPFTASKAPLLLARAAGWLLVAFLVFLPGAFLILEMALSDRWRPGDLLSGRLAGLFLRSLLLAGSSTALAALLGGGAAVILESVKMTEAWRTALRLLALAGLLLPPYYQVAVWRRLLGDLPGRGPEVRFLFAVLIFGFAYAPLILAFFSSGLRAIPVEIGEAARLSGESRWRIAARVILPLVSSSLGAGAALVFLLVFLNYEVPALLLLSAYPVEILIEYQATGDAGAAFFFALPAVAVAGSAAALAGRFFERGFSFAPSASTRFLSPLELGKGWSLLFWGLALLWVAWPLGKLFSMAGGARFFSNARAVLHLHGRDLGWSALVSLAAVVLAVLLAGITMLPRRRPPAWLRCLLWFPLAVPGPLLGAALIRIYNRPVLEIIYDGPGILIVAGVARFFPIAWHAASACWRSVPLEYLESAALSPAAFHARLLRVYLPLAAPGLALAAAAFLIFQSGELSASVLAAPPGFQPVPLTIYSLLHYNTVLETPAALCLFHLAAVLFMIGCFQLLARVWPAGKRTGKEHEPETR
ncbi:MAG: ABC transporter permease subunit [Planctomycetes bacterium]|nr:ABC transporter permease subunit [Planctomycetota bacterium]